MSSPQLFPYLEFSDFQITTENGFLVLGIETQIFYVSGTSRTFYALLSVPMELGMHN